MSGDPREDRQLREYLLGRLQGAERERIEERIFSDDALFESLEVARTELIADYTAGRLDAASRADCDRGVMSTRSGRRDRLIMRTLQEEATTRVAAAPPKRCLLSRFWAPALAFASVAAVAVLAVLYFASMTREREFLARERALQERIRELERTAAAKEPQDTQTIAGIVRYDLRLSDEITRSSGAGSDSPLLMPPSAPAVDLRIQLPASAFAYAGTLRRGDDGKVIWSGAPNSAEGPTLTFRVPAGVFNTGRYRLTVRAGRDIFESNFSIRTQR